MRERSRRGDHLPLAPLILVLLGAALAAAWIGLGLRVLKASRRVPLLEELLGPAPSGLLPPLSVIVAARDEAARIESTVRSFLAQRYPDLEVIAVDDRSSDGTGALLDRLAADPGMAAGRLVVIHNRDLPPGWIGKCHACHLGAARARGRWLLFTDGDVELARDDLLARVVDAVGRRRIDHLAVLPDLRPMPALQSSVVAIFGQMFLAAARAHETDRDRPRGGAGVGAFNLVRRSAYDRIGGHRLLRMDLADDFKLGRLLKESGARQRLCIGADLVRCPWHRGTLNVLRGLEKNFFAGFDYSLALLAAVTLAFLALTFGPLFIGLLATRLAFARPRSSWLGAAGPLACAWLPLLAQAAIVVRGYHLEAARHGFRPLTLALLHPVSILLLVGAAWNSALRTLARGGVSWRGTFYPLDELRRGQVGEGEGRRFLAGGGDDPSGGTPRGGEAPRRP